MRYAQSIGPTTDDKEARLFVPMPASGRKIGSTGVNLAGAIGRRNEMTHMGMGQNLTTRGPQVLVLGCICQGKPFWAPMFDPQPYKPSNWWFLL